MHPARRRLLRADVIAFIALQGILCIVLTVYCSSLGTRHTRATSAALARAGCHSVRRVLFSARGPRVHSEFRAHIDHLLRDIAERVVTVALAQGAAQRHQVAEAHGGRGARVAHGLGAQVEGAVAVAGVDQRGQQHLRVRVGAGLGLGLGLGDAVVLASTQHVSRE